MTRGLLVIGAGGHGKVVAETASLSQQWQEIAFVDDEKSGNDRIAGFGIVGTTKALEELRGRFSDSIVAVGDNGMRLSLLTIVAQIGFHIPAIVHPSAAISPSARIGAGTVVFAQAAVNADAELGEGVIINTGAVVEHDCIVANGAHLSPGVHLGGHVSIGERSWIGIGTSILPRKTIGHETVVGAGSAVISDLPDKIVAYGVPAKIQKVFGP